jgi:nitrogenase molybdenum-iron protein alpha/beta subunit
MKQRINKKTAYIFGYGDDAIVITRLMLECAGAPTDARVLRNIANDEKAIQRIIDDAFAADDREGCNRYDFFYPTADGRFGSVYEGSRTGLKSDAGDYLVLSDPTAPTECERFFNLVQI